MASSQTRKRTTAGKRKSGFRAPPQPIAGHPAEPRAPTTGTEPAGTSLEPGPETGPATAPGGAPPDTAAEAEAAHLADAAQPAGPQPMKKGDLLDAVKGTSPLSRGDLKTVMEAMLDQIGRALDEGREVVLPPFGKISVKKRKPAPNGDILTARIKRQGGGSADPDPAEE